MKKVIIFLIVCLLVCSLICITGCVDLSLPIYQRLDTNGSED